MPDKTPIDDSVDHDSACGKTLCIDEWKVLENAVIEKADGLGPEQLSFSSLIDKLADTYRSQWVVAAIWSLHNISDEEAASGRCNFHAGSARSFLVNEDFTISCSRSGADKKANQKSVDSANTESSPASLSPSLTEESQASILSVDRSDASDNLDLRGIHRKDADKVLYSNYFERLAGVTQVMSPNYGGRISTNRLTHSLKVAQVARSIGQTINSQTSSSAQFDLDLLEVAGLAHDLGHPPFGHVGEQVLDVYAREILGLNDGFEGNAQSYRIITTLEPRKRHSGGTSGFRGMNLSREAKLSILKYPWPRFQKFFLTQSDQESNSTGERKITLTRANMNFDTEVLHSLCLHCGTNSSEAERQVLIQAQYENPREWIESNSFKEENLWHRLANSKFCVYRLDYSKLSEGSTSNTIFDYPELNRRMMLWLDDGTASLHSNLESIAAQPEPASIMDAADDITYAVHDLTDFYRQGLLNGHEMLALFGLTRKSPDDLGEYNSETTEAPFPARMKNKSLFLASRIADLRSRPEFDNDQMLLALKFLREYLQSFSGTFNGSEIQSYNSAQASNHLLGTLIRHVGPAHHKSDERHFSHHTFSLNSAAWHRVELLKSLTKHGVVERPDFTIYQTSQKDILWRILEKLRCSMFHQNREYTELYKLPEPLGQWARKVSHLGGLWPDLEGIAILFHAIEACRSQASGTKDSARIIRVDASFHELKAEFGQAYERMKLEPSFRLLQEALDAFAGVNSTTPLINQSYEINVKRLESFLLLHSGFSTELLLPLKVVVTKWNESLIGVGTSAADIQNASRIFNQRMLLAAKGRILIDFVSSLTDAQALQLHKQFSPEGGDQFSTTSFY